ncbi:MULTISPECIES: hypothetical protein [unclassified Nitratiruptor]|uniref:hypothetical protein n=1 Tax=unclassified Nitratiruptor TaxID=2624044 RepID=UPI001916AB63|nr:MULTISPECIES: hypothetical protein [unclassified Nitratiruptor]BCD60033.1 hypothetical protein NitYY0810_C0796 [Nitratiruptor sp. YY08-10]BCD63955.1 hypothetical protein NitYY0814_C0794 [Nitratiruptor sp. YY08-14]BCD64476.1 hypothetical protein NitYY0814_C1323 [Nitratiruptor sp. YY08-14]
MTLFYIGEIVSHDVLERTDKTTGVVNHYVTVNVMMKMVTKDGKPKVFADDITLPIQYKNIIEQSVGKYIVIPYNYIQTKDKSYLFVDEKYQPVILDHNPLFEQKTTKKAA